MFFRMYQEKLQDFKQQLQHLNSGNNEYIVNFFFTFVYEPSSKQED